MTFPSRNGRTSVRQVGSPIPKSLTESPMTPTSARTKTSAVMAIRLSNNDSASSDHDAHEQQPDECVESDHGHKERDRPFRYKARRFHGPMISRHTTR